MPIELDTSHTWLVQGNLESWKHMSMLLLCRKTLWFFLCRRMKKRGGGQRKIIMRRSAVLLSSPWAVPCSHPWEPKSITTYDELHLRPWHLGSANAVSHSSKRPNTMVHGQNPMQVLLTASSLAQQNCPINDVLSWELLVLLMLPVRFSLSATTHNFFWLVLSIKKGMIVSTDGFSILWAGP